MEPIRRIVIVGGGTAGWMTAASLSHQLGHLNLDITLIESSDIGTVGVGEATVPAIRDYFKSLGLDTLEVMRETQGTAKLGIQFVGWTGTSDSFFHPFGLYGVPAGATAFHHICHRLREGGDDVRLADYNLCTQMALAGRFQPPNPRAQVAFEAYDWALHFDAGLFAKYLRAFAMERAVKRIDAKVTHVRVSSDGRIEAVQLETGQEITGDLFVDCSGFRALLIQGALESGYQDWKAWLPCDRAIALPCDLTEGATPYTRATALAAGWSWRIPLQHRVGNGYVYSSEHISDDAAERTLRDRLEGEVLADANRIRFRTGHATEVWKGNCVAIGLAAGFLEPLESTSIVLIQTGIEKLIKLLPGPAFNPATVREYNRTTALEYERIRDFILLHYWASNRDEPLWRACQNAKLPDALQHKIDVFRAQGHLVRYEWESFQDPSWLSMYAGFGLTAEGRDYTADRFSIEELREITGRMRADIAGRVDRAPTHTAWLQQHMGGARP